MSGKDIKFSFEYDFLDKNELDNIFKEIGDALNIQFDEDLNYYNVDYDDVYSFKDVSGENSRFIQTEMNNFFDYSFKDIVNKPLYKFLVLQNKDKIIILANISSQIFDYCSINEIYGLFDISTRFENNFSEYQDSIKKYLSSSDFENDSSYWKNHLSDIGNHVKFHNVKSKNCKNIKIHFDRQLLREFLKSEHTCEFDFFTAIFSLYLSRIDRTKGTLLKTITPTDNRNTLLKIDYSSDYLFIEYLNEINNIYLDAVSHTKVDIDNYLKDIPSYYSVFDFSDINDDIFIRTGEDSALTLNIYGDYLDLVYNADLFSALYIEHMASNIESLISNILNSPNQVVGEVNIICDEEISLLCEFYRGDIVDGVKDEAVASDFRKHAIKNPDIIAVDDGVNQITYGELERLSNSVAHDLSMNYGISRGDPICIMLPRTYHYPNVVLALNKLGAYFTPLDPIYPAQRIEYMINFSQSKAVITTLEFADSFDFDVDVICIEDLTMDYDVDVDIIASGDDLFSLVFTSGTTGLPKGVMLSNRQFIVVTTSYANIFKLTPSDNVGIFLSFSFIASYVLFCCLRLGVSCRIFNELEQKDSLLLLRELKEKPMHNIILPPGIGIPIFENEDLKLKYMILGGAEVGTLKNKEHYTKFVNFYGATESPIAIATIFDLNKIGVTHVPLGRPVANSWIYILDENGMMLPIGVPGEICISGGLISPGYYNDSEITKKSFVDNPYSDCEDNKIMYRTGDVGFYNFDGFIEFVGREDDQLSVRGFRIESNEILNIMNDFKEISDIYLDVDNDNLIAYYTLSDDLDINEVKHALENKLPYYMVPSLFIELDEIPLNINGKIDKSSLKKAVTDENIVISDEIILLVVDAFKEVLNLDFVRIDDDFVALGGNSLSAMKLQLLLNEKLDVVISSNELIDLSTPNDIANHIKFNLNVHSRFDKSKYSFEKTCPLSESQLNVYLDEITNNMDTAYNNPFKIDFNDNYSASEIKNALTKLFETFPILKSRVLNNDGVLSFIYDAEPEINEGSLNDMESFVKAFEFDKYLSRFLIVDDGPSVILCADFHHLIFDGTSLNILLNNLSSILNNENVDFIDTGILRQISFEESVDSDYMDDAKEFFDGMLVDRDEVYDLLPSVDGDDGESVLINTFDMDMESLSSFLQSHSITFNQFFASVFGYTLSRFSGSEKVLFNIVEDGRGHIDLSESVGMFVKTLPVLMDCKNQDITSFLEYSSNLINSAMKYDLYPFRILASEYDLNSNMLFQYSHNLFSDVINKENLKYSIDELKHDPTADLSFFIFNNGENNLMIRILYSSLYSKSFIERFAESYKLILYEMLKNDELKDIGYTIDEDICILDDYNQTGHELIYDDVLDGFNDNLLRNPESKLVSYNDISYSYGEGAYIADAIAKKLNALGVNAQECVGFLVPRSELYMFSVLGILSIGATYVPLDDALPDERIEFMLKDTDSRVIIANDETYSRAEELSEDITILNISDILKEDIKSSVHLPVVNGDVASILYTSGTTGVPKGVKITRKSLLNVANFYCDVYGLNDEDVYGLFSAIGFDMSSFIISAVICAGACMSVIPEEIRFNISELNRYFIKQNVTHAFITTQVGKLFMQSVEDTSLDVLVVAGEMLGEIESPKDYRLIDAYGPTEALFVSTIDNGNKLDGSSVGMLNYNTQSYVLDSQKRRVPCGAVGELYLSGLQIAEGYLNRPEESLNTFIDNPFTDDENHSTLYATGDMVRILPDGSIGIVGRRDSQVKIRGNRVELSEVENVIRDLDCVDDVTVQTVKNGDNHELVAYVVSNKMADDIIEESIKDYIRKCKPDYMVPSFVVSLDSIPLNVNGKVDRRALPKVDIGALRSEYVPARNDIERDIVNAFENVFNQENIGIYDDFARLGGDSLTAIKLLTFLDDYNISVVNVLSLRTPYAIANNVKDISMDLDVYSLDSGCPLSESQLNVYLDIIANEKVDSYLIPILMNISKEYEVQSIVNALNEMFRIHPVLSMCIGNEFDVPHLIKGSAPLIRLESESITDEDIIEFLTQSFDLHDYLCRFMIVEGTDEYSLFAVFHHLIFDALSNRVFKQDLLSILEGESIDIDDSFLKASAFSKQIQGTDNYLDAVKFYESMFADIDESYELMDCVGADGPGSIQIDLDLDYDTFKSVLSKYGVSENIVFTGAFAYTLSRFTGGDKVLFSIIENGRGRFNNLNSIGMFVNTLPLLVDCKNQSVSSFMEHMSDLVYGVMKYNYYPFRQLANDYGIVSDILFQFFPSLDYGGEDYLSGIFEGYDLLGNQNDFISDLNANVFQDGEEYSLIVSYSDKYSLEFVERLTESYKLILHGIIESDDLSDINYVTPRDIELLDIYNNTEHPLVYDDVLDAFNDNLAKYPDNTLVSFDDKSYTYAQGAFIADSIAKSLMNLGVETGDCVAFLVARSEWYMFSVLGVLSVGAVPVPVDDKLPDERIKFMLNDSDSKVIVACDSTWDRISNLSEDVAVLNVSDINIQGNLSYLPVIYGDLAGILYTSGTTGIPKGVKVTRKAVLNVSAHYCDVQNLNQDDIYAMYPSIGFDAGYKSIFKVLYSGACFTVVPDEIKFNMDKLNDYFVRQNVGHVFITTQVSKLFMESVESTSLKVLSVGGEKLGEFESPEQYIVMDDYGPTEAFAFITSINISQRIDGASIGFLNYNSKAYVLDNERRRTPYGAVGELYLAGYQISDGYLNREEETVNAFVDNPFDESIMYRTGDMVRFLPDGSLGLVGRRDSQVKIRGNRVELSEVENVIRDLDCVDDVTVQAVKNADNYELVAYVVPSQDIKDESLREAVCNYIGDCKPDYMIPSYVVRLDSIPLTVNGKVDKRALPSFDLDNLHADYIAPTNELESIIVSAFEVAFNQKDIGLFDDFARLGGDSITAIRLISLLQKNNINVTAKDILTYKTPYLIAQNVEKASGVSYDSTVGEVELLPIQSYYFNQVNDDAFTQQYLLKSAIDLDLDLLQNAFDELCNVHDMLRASYKRNEGNVIQEISPINTQVCNINEYSITDDFNESLRNIFINSCLSIDVEKNNFVDVSIIRHDGECYVLFVIHHLIIDGVSWNILLDDLTYIYNQLASGETISLDTPYPYKYWVNDVKKLVGDITDEEKQYWIDINDLLDDSDIKGKSNSFSFKVDADFIIDNLLMLSEEEFLGLAIARAYNKTYKKDIIFNRESHGRDENIGDVSRTVGWFTSQYPMPINVGNGEDHISIMQDVYTIKEAFKNVNHLGLNYSSLIYTTEELEFKHCPVTFNFLSKEFIFKNSLFESYNLYVCEIDSNNNESDNETFGISFNVSNIGDSYRFDGNFALGTYIGDKFDDFVENIKSEMELIAKHQLNNDIVCYLSELQLGVYLDEKVHDKKTAYSVSGSFPVGDEYSIDEIRNAIRILIDKHPIFKGRIIDNPKLPLMICDANPAVEIIEGDTDVNDLIKKFDLNKTLSRFYIIDNEKSRSIFYDMHHIISDATSNMLIKNELDNILSGDFNGDVDLGFVYASYYSWEAQFKPEYESARKFFHSVLYDIDDVQYLLSDVDASVGCVCLPVRGVRSRVESFVRKHGITVGSFLNAIFAYTYSRFTGSDKVYYTFTEHGRHEEYAQDAVGMFVRTIPVIIDCANTSIEEYLSGVSDRILDCMKHGSYPFRLLARRFDLNHDVSFEYNYDLNDVSGIGDEIVHLDIADEVSEFLCVVNDLDDGYLISLNHLDILSQDTAERFVKVFKEILIQFLDKSYLKDINYISNEDLELLDSINQTEYSLVYDDVLDAFNDNLKKYPKNKLVSMNGNSYSYGEGAYICDRIAKKLGDLGVMPEDCVGFLTERSEYYMFCILGILSVGGVYVPLDDNHPDERIKFLLDDTSSHVVIVSDETYNRVNNLIGGDVVLLNISEIVNESIGSLNYLPVVYGNVACILYTSGSTGIPKGVRITRKSVLNLSSYYCDTYGLTNGDVYGLYASIGFDAGSQAILQSVYAGSCLSVIPEDIKFNIDKLNEYLIKENVDQIFIPTQVAKLFMDDVKYTSLKKLFVGGEKLGSFESPECYSLFDAYGPTETFAFVSSINNLDKMHESCVGFLNYNTKAYVVDSDFRRVPLGAIGELCLSGYQVADGYLNREEENLSTFIDNPFDDSDDYEVLYRTGDMVRLLSDGSLSIVGRLDSQLKIRGNCVELSEVESVIRNMELIDDVTVQPIRNENNNELVAYVVPSQDIKDETLKDIVCGHVGEYNPDYMIPSYVVKLDEIPLNVNGKVDKHALPDFDRNGLHAKYVAPRDENEKEIVEAFEKALNLEKVSIYDDFIRLGGNSLNAIRLLSYINSNDVTMVDILTFRTPEAIAKNMSDFSFDLDLYTLESGCPLNAAQLNVFADVEGYNKKNAYHVPGYIHIPKEYGLEDILGALDEMLNVHPILGMRLSDRYEENDADDIRNLDIISDLIKTAKKFGIKKIMNIISSYGLRNINGLYNMIKTIIRLFKGEYPYMVKGEKPQISVKSKVDTDTIIDFFSESLDIYNNLSKFLIVETEESYYLFYVIHHIIFDAVSAGVFKHDFELLLDGGSVSLDDTFLKASAYTQQIKNTDKFEEASEYYYPILSSLDDVGMLLEDNSSEGYSRLTWDLKFDKMAFKSFLNNAGISENVLFTGVFAYALSQFVDGDKVLFTMIENGRDRFNGNFIGMTSNVMPLVADCKDRSINSFMKDMADAVYGISRHSYYPILLLYQKYNFEVNTLFQFVPNWIADDFNNVESIEDIGSEEIMNNILNSYGDNITEFFVEIYQYGENYRLLITNSNKYSNKLIEDFKDAYISILLNIINTDLDSNLNATLNSF
jgi:amino acid adenylation domain-containing protein